MVFDQVFFSCTNGTLLFKNYFYEILGMMALKSLKLQWTLNDFVSLDEQFVYKIKSCDASFCSKVTMDEACINNFIRFMQVYDFKRTRMGYLYGNFGEDNSVNVEVRKHLKCSIVCALECSSNYSAILSSMGEINFTWLIYFY